MTPAVVFLAGGGSGGHVFPLVAVAHAMKRLLPDIRPIFVGTSRGMEVQFVPQQGFELELLDVLPIRGGGVAGAVRGALRACALLPESRALINKYQPRAVLSVGGYAAGPVALAARSLGLPVALMEPNSVIGLANWLSIPLVERAYTAFEMTERHFPPGVVLRTGVPMRPGFLPVPPRMTHGVPRVLVLGGSQGAKALNQILPQALSRLTLPLTVTHQCGRAHVDAVTEQYRVCAQMAEGRPSALRVEVVPFITDMPHALAEADLVVGRAGAGAVSEIAAVGRPSLLIPYPYASGDHQRVNAELLQQGGAARCLLESEASVARVATELETLLKDRVSLQVMARAAAQLGRPAAAETVARDFLALSGLIPAIRGAGPTGGDRAARNPLSEVA